MSRRLTADAGGTSTDWLFEDSSTDERQLVTTRGFNAAVQAPQELAQIVAELPPEFLQTDRMAFFGAGCRGQFETATGALLSGLFPKAEIETGSDLLGAARALFADRPGIACILGTGSASGLYDGHRICVSTPSLGYIVGDEGSGAVLGRIFLERAFKGQLPAAICAEVTSMLSVDELITRVYRTPGANTWLAGFTRVIARHISCPEIEEMVTDEFERFLRYNVAPYFLPSQPESSSNSITPLPLGFVGSVAAHFAPQLRRAASSLNLTLSSIRTSPLRP